MRLVKSITWFCICRHRHNGGVILFTPLCLTYGLKNGRVFSINLNHWIYESENDFLSFYFMLYRSILTRTDTCLEIFASFEQVWVLGLLYTAQHFATFVFVFLFDFLKWHSTLQCQIYWIPDLQSWKLVYFVLLWITQEAKLGLFHTFLVTRWQCLLNRQDKGLMC